MSKKRSPLESRILDYLDRTSLRVPINQLQAALEDAEPREIVDTLNILNKRCLVDLTHENSTLIITRRSHEEAEKLRHLEGDERTVYTHVARSGNMGIWIRDLRLQTELQQAQLTKLLKVLQTRKLIKAVKSVASKGKKFYMLFDLEPSVTHTGGVLYDDNQQFDYTFVDNLFKIIQAIVKRKGAKGCSIRDILAEIKQRSLTKNVELSEDVVETLAHALVLDGLLREVKKLDPVGAYVSYYFCSNPLPFCDFLSFIPCSRCPVRNKCQLTGDITPYNCLYLSEWGKGVSGLVGEGDLTVGAAQQESDMEGD
ncbi:hypothetical protein RCL1_008820 [Eukaryota sp. TZLM3-RCL]